MKQKERESLSANEILEVIFVYLTEISSRREYNELLELLANMGRTLTNADRCSVWVLSDDKKTLETKVSHGVDSIRIPVGRGIVGSAIEMGEKIIIDDVYRDPRFNTEVDKKTGYKTKSMLVVPMYDNNNNIIGAFQAINRRGKQEHFDKRDIQRLMLASTYAAETLVAVKLEEEITQTQQEVVFTMGAIGESRSKETGNHVKRVAEYSKILALAYGLPKEEAELLKQASPMHDIGKVAIPDAILNKPGRFDENEREIMNRHAELGYQMVNKSKRPLLKAAATIAYEHHEKWDGSGYPRGIKENEIHIYGRITALADVFDALGSDRVYKKAWDDERIFKLLHEERGKYFDPQLVDVFFENLDEILQIRETFKDRYKGTPQADIKESRSIKVLGAYGTRAKDKGTISILLNKSNVIDAGNLLNSLDVATTEIDTIWLTHSHLDHIVDIAYIIDNYFRLRTKSLKIIALKETLDVLQKNFLNNEVWPDFSKIKLGNGKEAVIYEELSLSKKYKISDREYIEAFPTDHTVPSCGYIYTKDESSILFTADTQSLDSAAKYVNNRKNISAVVIECSFPNELAVLAKESKHLTPNSLFAELKKFTRDDFALYINHLKPSYEEKIIKEIEQNRGKWQPKIIKDGNFITF